MVTLSPTSGFFVGVIWERIYCPSNSTTLIVGVLGLSGPPRPVTSFPALSVDVIQNDTLSPSSMLNTRDGEKSISPWYTAVPSVPENQRISPFSSVPEII